jgi:DNA-binding transcriptional LysR family regulator
MVVFTLELKQLEYFQTVAKLQHYTHAAEKIMLSQPALSRSMANLEDELGVPLFDRVGRSVRLNHFGNLFLHRVNAVLNEINAAKQEIAESLDAEHGTISLAFLPTLGTHLVPEILNEFHAKHPHIHFQLSQKASSFILDDLANGNADLCLSLPPHRQQIFNWTNLINEELFLIVPANNHRLSNRISVRLSEVSEDPFILLKHGFGLRSVTEKLCQTADYSPNIVFEADEVATVIGFVAAGFGISLIPYIEGMNLRKVKHLTVTDPKCERKIVLTRMKNRYLSAAAQRFHEFVVDYFAD